MRNNPIFVLTENQTVLQGINEYVTVQALATTGPNCTGPLFPWFSTRALAEEFVEENGLRRLTITPLEQAPFYH